MFGGSTNNPKGICSYGQDSPALAGGMLRVGLYVEKDLVAVAALEAAQKADAAAQAALAQANAIAAAAAAAAVAAAAVPGALEH